MNRMIKNYDVYIDNVIFFLYNYSISQKYLFLGGIVIKKILDVLGLSDMAENFKNVRTISLTAVLFALTVIGNGLMKIPLAMNLEIKFGFVFLSTIAYLFGPVVAFAAGFLTNMLGFLLFPTGAGFNPIFDLNVGLSGILYALFLYKRNQKSEYFIIWIVAAKASVNLICNIIINTRLLMLFGYIPANAAVIVTIARVFKNFALMPIEIILMFFILKFVSVYAQKFNFIKLTQLKKT